MSKTLIEVARDALDLPHPERLKLARILLDLSDMDGETAPDEAQAAWDSEIERRLQELRSAQVKGVPLEQVKRSIEARFAS